VAAGFSQHELAERAGLSQRAISDLERGERRSPHPATVRRLARALDLDRAKRASLLASVGRTHEPDNAVRRRNQPPLAGRERELDMLVERLAAARRGDSGIVLLSGEPGVGKTRLLNEMADRAAATGWRVLVGQAFDSDGMPPYLPFIDALREHILASPVGDLERQLGDGAPEVALVLPEIRRRLPGLAPGTHLEPEGDRYRLFDSISEFICEIAREKERGLLLCIDDLHWADHSTLLLLEHLCRRLRNAPLLILATYRDTELVVGGPLAHTLEQLTRQPISQRIDIKGLDFEGVRLMLAGLGRPQPPPSVVEAVYDETEGNPFFVREVFEYLADAGRLFDIERRWRRDLQVGVTEVPQGVRLVIGRRLERLSAECRAVLGLAAVLGRTLDYQLLRATSEMSEEALLVVLEAAERAQLLVSDDSGRLSFAHELIRQTLLSALTALRRQRLHLRVAKGIEDLHADDLTSYLAEIAGHYRLAGAAADPSKFIDYSIRAGEHALNVRAFAETTRLLGDAIAAIRALGGPPPSGPCLVDMHRKCGRAYISLARWSQARAQLEAALELLSVDATPERSALLTDLAVCCRWDNDLNNCRRYAEEARRLAERLNRPDLQAGAMASVAFVEFSEGDIARGAKSYGNAIERARSGDWSVSKTAEAGFGHLLYLSGRHSESVEHGLQAVGLARESSDMATLTYALGPLGLSLAATGRYTEAEEVFGEARQVGNQYGIEGFLARAISMSATPHLDLFDFAGALEIAQEASQLAHRFNFVSAIVSTEIDCLLIRLRSGQLGPVIEALPGVRDLVVGKVNAQGTWLHGWLWSLRLAQIEAEVTLAQSDWREAVRLATASIEASRARMRPKYESAGLATRAQALAALGRKREAMADMSDAVTVARNTTDPAMFLRTAASMLRLEADAPLADEANQCIARILNGVSNPQVRRRFEESDTVQFVYSTRGPDWKHQLPSTTHPDGLSPREAEVLRLVAEGKSNAQIAHELVISVNTVQRHVGNILTKTGLANRTQAASYAHRAGFFD
jgi:DNA-binding CsgD family transcriptional regulator/transcriptional regulator with XRE-family HTH domain/tetratricopeptide (TPR) repeat protein